MKILAALKNWNISLKDPSYDSNFKSRKILQKLTYICQSLGVDMNYYFDLYIHGPYCTTLANDYYEYHNNVPKKSTTYKPNEPESEIFNRIKNIVFSNPSYQKNSVEFLEAIATIIFLKKTDPNMLDDDLFEKTKENKPYISDKIIIIAINIVKQLFFKPEDLTDEIKGELDMWDSAED